MTAATRKPAAAILVVLSTLGCDRDAPPPPATRPAVRTIASTVPAVTDLIVGMGAADRLVAVSTYDRDRPDVGTLPKAGDYQTTDWEVLAEVRPSVLVTAITPSREPAGFGRHAADLGVEPINLQVDHLPELEPAIDALGVALAEPALAAAADRRIDAQLAAVRRQVAGLPRVPTLIVISPDATAVAGPGTYLDDLLQTAGGTNAAASLRRPWPTVDREMLVSFRPAVVLQLLPGASPQELARAAAVWASLPPVRVCTITDPYALQPGWHLPELAGTFARCLHPSSSAPSTAR